MRTTILDRPNLRTGSVDEGTGDFGHTFGGPARHDGVLLAGLDRPAHLLSCFDLSDPALGLSIPGLRWLPIYHAFYASGLVYRVATDDRIEILEQPFAGGVPAETRRASARFPARFRQRRVTVQARPDDPKDHSDLAMYGAVLGAGGLTEAEKKELQKDVEENYPGLIIDLLGEPPYSSFDEFLSHMCGILFPHGLPRRVCPGGCKKGRSRLEMTFWLNVEPEEDDKGDYRRIYQAVGGADSGRRRVLVCPKCYTVAVANPCT
jgi:hypothetical protein